METVFVAYYVDIYTDCPKKSDFIILGIFDNKDDAYECTCLLDPLYENCQHFDNDHMYDDRLKRKPQVIEIQKNTNILESLF
jgi:hypothetical protein